MVSVRRVASRLRADLGCDATIILIGSAARGKETWRSDVDLLVITPALAGKMRSPRRFHLLYQTRERFVSRLNSGDDFAVWAFRYGRPLSDDSRWWQDMLAQPPNVPWPDWEQKLGQADKRLIAARKALEDGDTEAAEEEYLMAASHLARASLLRAGVFPLSRPELPDQLRVIGRVDESQMLAELILGEAPDSRLKEIGSELARWHLELATAAGRNAAVKSA